MLNLTLKQATVTNSVYEASFFLKKIEEYSDFAKVGICKSLNFQNITSHPLDFSPLKHNTLYLRFYNHFIYIGVKILVCITCLDAYNYF